MTKQIKTALLTGLFFFVLHTGLQAQQKYSYAMMEAANSPMLMKSISVSIDGSEVKNIDVPKGEIFSVGVYNIMIREVKKMEADGWELLDTHVVPIANSAGQTSYSTFFFQFRKKTAY